MKNFISFLFFSTALASCASTPTSNLDTAAVVPMASKPLNESRAISRIAFGSCLDEASDQSIWQTLANEQPDMFLFLGDNVYGDARRDDPEFLDPTMPKMRRSYAALAADQSFADFRKDVPILTTWDDHDYGVNDGGADYMFKDHAKQLYLSAWDVPANDDRHRRGGVYTSSLTGPSGQRVQIILLDTRSFRTALTKTDQKGAPGKERYVPSTDRSGTMLGAAQWAWLETELSKPADLRIIASSIQMHADGHGWEAWRTMPHEQGRFYELVKRSNENNIILLSGDRHAGGIYKREGLYEVTSSSLNRAFYRPQEITDSIPSEAGPYRIGPMQFAVNYGLIEIDWDTRAVDLILRSPNNPDMIQTTKF